MQRGCTEERNGSLLLLERAHERGLLLERLEATVTELGCGIDELEGNVFEVFPLGMDEKSLANGNDTSPRTGDRAFDHNVVGTNLAVVREAAHRCNVLLRDVGLRSGIANVATVANTVDLLVPFYTMMVSVLTGTGDREHDL